MHQHRSAAAARRRREGRPPSGGSGNCGGCRRRKQAAHHHRPRRAPSPLKRESISTRFFFFGNLWNRGSLSIFAKRGSIVAPPAPSGFPMAIFYQVILL
jgi:hypothetical protein